jgi:hypothetical protein
MTRKTPLDVSRTMQNASGAPSPWEATASTASSDSTTSMPGMAWRIPHPGGPKHSVLIHGVSYIHTVWAFRFAGRWLCPDTGRVRDGEFGCAAERIEHGTRGI